VNAKVAEESVTCGFAAAHGGKAFGLPAQHKLFFMRGYASQQRQSLPGQKERARKPGGFPNVRRPSRWTYEHREKSVLVIGAAQVGFECPFW
jgi:hypothetical protein